MTILNIIGLKVVAIKGWAEPRELRKKKPKIKVRYIFFGDGETYIELDEQDYHSYHDCSCLAREIDIHRDKEMYDHLFNTYYDSTYGEWY